MADVVIPIVPPEMNEPPTGISIQQLEPLLGSCAHEFPPEAMGGEPEQLTSKFGMAAEEPDTLYL